MALNILQLCLKMVCHFIRQENKILYVGEIIVEVEAKSGTLVEESNYFYMERC